MNDATRLVPARLLLAMSLAALTGGRAAARQGDVTIVNLIPKAQSAETNQDSEPHLTVNLAKPTELVASAFTPNPLGGSRAPIFLSTDGGKTWDLRTIVPSSTATGDITVHYGGGGRLYAGILRLPSPPNDTRLNILSTDTPTGTGLMKVLVDRNGVDQPFVHVADAGGKDRVLVGDNDFAGGDGKTATIDSALDPKGGGTFKALRLDTRGGNPDKGAMDGPQIRPAFHPSGTAYAAFYGWREFVPESQARGIATADVVVVRDDAAGDFTALKEGSAPGGDGLAGVRVRRGITLPWINDVQADFGQERVGGDLAIAVDPRPAAAGKQVVYLAYADRPTPGSEYTLHLVRSDDGGATWQPDLRTLPRAKNPALAVNEAGKVAFLYQAVSAPPAGAVATPGEGQAWSTVLERSTDAFKSHDQLILAKAPADVPAAQFSPYLGDYLHLIAVGKDFYGIFSMNNTPDPANFPAVRPVYQRNADFTAKRLLAVDNATPITPSIDPFFFKVTEH